MNNLTELTQLQVKLALKLLLNHLMTLIKTAFRNDRKHILNITLLDPRTILWNHSARKPSCVDPQLPVLLVPLQRADDQTGIPGDLADR